MRDANYCLTGVLGVGAAATVHFLSMTTTGFQIVTRNPSGTPMDYFNVFFDVTGGLS
jgi:hypothetical protein